MVGTVSQVLANMRFTFQYGTNLISYLSVTFSQRSLFTFQYGTNLIYDMATDLDKLFKFTFQYGTNLIVVNSVTN